MAGLQHDLLQPPSSLTPPFKLLYAPVRSLLVALSQPYAFFSHSGRVLQVLQLPTASYSFLQLPTVSTGLPHCHNVRHLSPTRGQLWKTYRNYTTDNPNPTHIPFSASPFPPVRGFVHTGAVDAQKSLVQALLQPATGPFSGASLAP